MLCKSHEAVLCFFVFFFQPSQHTSKTADIQSTPQQGRTISSICSFNVHYHYQCLLLVWLCRRVFFFFFFSCEWVSPLKVCGSRRLLSSTSPRPWERQTSPLYKEASPINYFSQLSVKEEVEGISVMADSSGAADVFLFVFSNWSGVTMIPLQIEPVPFSEPGQT